MIGGVPGGVVGGAQGPVIRGVGIKERLDRKTPGDFRFDNAPVDDVLSALGKILEMEVRVEGLEAGKRVTLDLSNQTVFAALKTLEDQVGGKGLIFVLDSAGKKMVSVRVKSGKPTKKIK